MDQALLTLLQEDPRRNRAAWGFFENQPLLRAYRRGKCALILGQSDHLWMHSIGDAGPDMATLLCGHYRETPYFYSIEDSLVPLVKACAEIEWIFPTLRYDRETPENVPAPDISLLPVDPEWIPELYAQSDYKDYTSEAYIRDRLLRDISVCIKDNGKLAAWAFTHDDGSLGFLHVRLEYRRRGYGSQILRALIRMRAIEGKAIFCNIVPENGASIRMVEKLGFRQDRQISWLKLKES